VHITGKGKGKVVPMYAMMVQKGWAWGIAQAQLISFLASVLDGDEWSDSGSEEKKPGSR
jgi:hypothetical protein